MSAVTKFPNMPKKLLAKPAIAVDFDDVLFPTVPKLIDYYNRRFRKNLIFDNIQSYDPWDFWGISREEAIRVVDDFISDFDPLPHSPIDGSLTVIDILRNSYNLYIVTARMKSSKPGTIAWLNKYFPDRFQDVIFCEQYGQAKLHQPKASICRKINAAYMIDDALHHLDECQAVGIKPILFGDYPWNRTDDLPQGIIRASHWKQVANIIRSKS